MKINSLHPKYVFFGSPEFAKIVLEELVAGGLIPHALVCNPDKPAGRKKELTSPATKQYIRISGLRVPVLQPHSPSDAKHELAALKPDLFIVAAYAKIIPEDVLMIPNLGAIGVHPSLLPKHRGASPVQTSILEGDTTTGVSLFLMDEKVDHGPVLAEESCPIDDLSFKDLLIRLAHLGGKLGAKNIPLFSAGKSRPIPQKHENATFTSKFTSEDGFVDPEDLAEALSGKNSELALEISRKIRALGEEPGVWTWGSALASFTSKPSPEKRVKLFSANVDTGRLILTLIQVEGKNPTTLR
ncbi:MAG: methionyl-tRNA formyltransferase [Patescibacteria group bacterium]